MHIFWKMKEAKISVTWSYYWRNPNRTPSELSASGKYDYHILEDCYAYSPPYLRGYTPDIFEKCVLHMKEDTVNSRFEILLPVYLEDYAPYVPMQMREYFYPIEFGFAPLAHMPHEYYMQAGKLKPIDENDTRILDTVFNLNLLGKPFQIHSYHWPYSEPSTSYLNIDFEFELDYY